MTTKSDIDQLLDTLESCGRDLPAHMVRQLLRMLAARCDELEEKRLHDFMQWQARCGKIEDGLALINIENRLVAMETRLTEVVDQVAEDIEDAQDSIVALDYRLDKLSGESPPSLTIAEFDKQLADDTEHLLASPRNAEALAKSIKQALAERPMNRDEQAIGIDGEGIGFREKPNATTIAAMQEARSIKQADDGRRATDKFYADYYARLKFIAEAVKKKSDLEALRRRTPSGEDEGSFW